MFEKLEQEKEQLENSLKDIKLKIAIKKLNKSLHRHANMMDIQRRINRIEEKNPDYCHNDKWKELRFIQDTLFYFLAKNNLKTNKLNSSNRLSAKKIKEATLFIERYEKEYKNVYL